MTNKNEVALLQKDVTDQVNARVNEMQTEGLALPKNYNHSNALKSAFFTLQETRDSSKKKALEVCTKESIANALLDMVTQGLSPAKTQCYFVVYGNQLKLQRSYFGTQAVLKRLTEVENIWANVIYKGDEFDYSITDGRERLVKHDTKFENRDNEILGAYAVIKTENDEILTVMTKKEIEVAWGQSRAGQAVHKKFPQEMAKRTVINRAAKAYINTSDDSDLLIEAINRSTENEYTGDQPIKDVTQEIKENANQETIDFEEEKIDESEEPDVVIEEPNENTRNKVSKKAEPEIIEPGF